MRHHRVPNFTAEYLRSILDYAPSTGVFVWKGRSDAPTANTRWVGKVAGCTSGKYSVICINFKKYSAHRLAWYYVYGEWPKNEVDHVKNNKLDNRISKLRIATHAQNSWNTILRASNKSGYKGVSFCKQTGLWVAHITKNYKTYNLGRYKTPEEAHSIYCEAAQTNYGEFANSGSTATIGAKSQGA